MLRRMETIARTMPLSGRDIAILGVMFSIALLPRLLDVCSVQLMRGYPWFMIERPMVLAIAAILVIIAFTAIGVLLSGYGNCC